MLFATTREKELRSKRENLEKHKTDMEALYDRGFISQKELLSVYERYNACNELLVEMEQEYKEFSDEYDRWSLRVFIGIAILIFILSLIFGE